MLERITVLKKHPYDGGDPVELGPGVACYLWQGPKNKSLTLGCVKCGLVHAITDHVITWHDEATVTIVPSIRCSNPKCDAHFYITRNEIKHV